MRRHRTIEEIEADAMIMCPETLAYRQGMLLNEARRHFDSTVEGKRAASHAFLQWHQRVMSMDKATVSRLRLYATLPASAARLGASRGYVAARAVRAGLVTTDEAVAMSRGDLLAALQGAQGA